MDVEVEAPELMGEEFISTRVPMPPAQPRSASLGARRTLMRRFTLSDGERAMPTVAELVKHAEKHGSNCIAETAAECGYGYEPLVRIIDGCDRADLAILRKDRGERAKLDRRPPSETRAKLILGIKEDEAE